MSGNDVLWTFVNFAGEDHNNFQTLVAFLKMLSTLVCDTFITAVLLSESFHKMLTNIDVTSSRPLLKRVLQRFLIYFRTKHFAPLDGAPCLIVYQFMTKSSSSPY